jgi:hypothetical protein
MVLADPDSYEIVTFDDIEAVPISFAKAGYSEADA